jgi:hypothetical protein
MSLLCLPSRIYHGHGPKFCGDFRAADVFRDARVHLLHAKKVKHFAARSGIGGVAACDFLE